MSKLDDAIIFAANVHKGQARKGDGLPYITHPIRVMERLSRAGVKDENVLIAAVLHDTIEDSPSPFISIDIENMFGPTVRHWVGELSFLSGLKPGSKERKVAKREYLQGFVIKSKESCLVKMADRIDNLLAQPRDPVEYAKDGKILLDAALQNTRAIPIELIDPFRNLASQLEDLTEYPEARRNA